LGCGSRFGLILTPFVDDTFQNLLFIDLEMSEAIGGCIVPQSAAKAPDIPTVETCNTNWLNSIDQSTVVERLPILTLCSADSSLIIISFSLNGL
jgi:hypothetical protein